MQQSTGILRAEGTGWADKTGTVLLIMWVRGYIYNSIHSFIHSFTRSAVPVQNLVILKALAKLAGKKLCHL